MRSRPTVIALSLACAVVLPTPLMAQGLSAYPTSSADAGRWLFDMGVQYAHPTGAFAAQVDRAVGVGGSVRYHFRGFAPLGLRGDLAWMNYGNERKRVPLSSTINRVLVEMNTANDIALVTAGPELMVTAGPLRPYAFAFAGYSYFYTETSVGDGQDGGSFARSTNFHDGGPASGWGGGLRIPLSVRRVDVAIDGGARFTHNGVRTYLRRGDIVDQPDGSLLLSPRTTPANFVQYYVAASFAPRIR